MSNLRHGRADTPTYRVWRAMRSRCENPNVSAYPDYGGRGITVCERWRDFANFFADMGDPMPGMTLDRIDNDLGYSPANCRWATRGQQARNKRGLHTVEIDGVSHPICKWAEISGVKLTTICARLKKGWAAREAVFAPPATDRRRHEFGAKHGVIWSDPAERKVA